ncbi:xanthine dehydrogenase family protein subunit M [Agrobacterium sp. SHOUNA12C]|uniref:Xanthine dehydrogenase protein n=2 Tax=Rhizobium rhizogenes TaxID=359 RepID=B9JBW3_RHIR8|nr:MULTISPECIES: xanthine dehydrogenase family protein subunit M [Rhizobium]ACM28009.1 xanthine dehydrogenase protein [Rhizobium rhizogenes K84]MCJ9723745.1 xanthine dehydrogenase family protein subunit M [Agrobacterium sp. BETTINA12B]MCJ9760455.1 xanthine dehydrogenase family protein subunit M [Agrobacterium sp. SHOUNA12C]OCI94919.1 carbon monoxide dehydrogenase [Agrobacterium sp. 13-626]OCJ08915.1 carbon monoxide dehydrogenase [Agrobacterium sp. B131/95]OCJ14304.1 carbon monoxide dehydrogen
MYATNYHRASSVDEAVKLLSGADEGKYVSGGMTLIATMKQRLASPSDLVDLRHIPSLKGIRVDGRRVTIGAAATHAEVASSAAIRAVCPALCDLAGMIGDPHVRHMGTIGGSVANNDPAADYPSAMLGLGATIVTDKRQITADDFFTGLFETALEDGELITAITFEAPEKAGYAKFPNPASRYAMTGVFVAKGVGGVRVAVTGAGADGVFRHAGMEQALAANWAPDAVANATVDSSALMSDLHATAEYRANLIKVMAKRAVAAA